MLFKVNSPLPLFLQNISPRNSLMQYWVIKTRTKAKKARMQSIGSKSLNGCKKVVVKLNYLILLTEWLKRNFSYISMILPLEFSEILTVFRIYSVFHTSARLKMDVIKFVNHIPEEKKSFAWYNFVDFHKLCFYKITWSFFSRFRNYDSFTFFTKNFPWILKK